ncbi:hypothetical protein D7V80_03435 [Corallococcus sp. CA054B]|uniref:LirA/MavJ family T4SS effector n=1 Tax=Corallococcus sp. CA054B TaxID=2316734 RepID=UPI000EA170BB|nr:LirA/MavJ family T4SS effector [Corallococcus sp. CA054B]RKG70986.1 hypothetical protein D7V80_03435 [Corallococcus sp. CA054B]
MVNIQQLHGAKLNTNMAAGMRRIQELLRDEEEVQTYLKRLEDAIARCPGGKGGKTTPTAKLSLVLEDTEKRWMRSGVDRLSPEEGVVEVINFLVDHLWQRRALKDVGAGPQHGEHSHRIQWYIIFHYFRSKGAPISSIQDLYDTMVSPTHTATNMVGIQVSLWDSVLDVRFSWLNGRHDAKPVPGLSEIYGDVKYASPVFLNEALTRPESKLIELYPRLSAALTHRRLKRTPSTAAKTRELLQQCLVKAQMNINLDTVGQALCEEVITDVVSSQGAHTYF